MGKQLDIEDPLSFLNIKEVNQGAKTVQKTEEKLKNIGVAPSTHYKIKQLISPGGFYYGLSIKDLVDKLVTEALRK